MNMMYTDERSLFQRAALKQRPREPVFSLADGLVSQMAASRVRQQQRQPHPYQRSMDRSSYCSGTWRRPHRICCSEYAKGPDQVLRS